MLGHKAATCSSARDAHEPGRLTHAKKKKKPPSSLRRSHPVSIRRFVTDEPIRTPVTPRELKITHRLPSFVCCQSGMEGVVANSLYFPSLMSLIVFTSHSPAQSEPNAAPSCFF